MKTIALFLSFLVVSFSSAHALKSFDDEPVTTTKKSPYKKMIHFNPLALTIGGLELGYETSVTHKESFIVNVGYYLSQEAGFLDLKDDYSNMNGFRIEMQYRFYRKNNNYIRNVFLAPFFNLKTQSADHNEIVYTPSSPSSITKTTTYSASTIGVGYMLGSRKSIFENIYLDAAIGGGVFIPVSGDHHKELNIGLFNPFQKGVQFKASFGILIAL
ncbi:MAG: hypothetical protein IT245_03165 [Bacteroidia bacterium]|nr:hypothetical protein [Bacteroidia bacterium]